MKIDIKYILLIIIIIITQALMFSYMRIIDNRNTNMIQAISDHLVDIDLFLNEPLIIETY